MKVELLRVPPPLGSPPPLQGLRVRGWFSHCATNVATGAVAWTQCTTNSCASVMTGTVPVRAIAQMLSLSIGSSTTLVFGVKSFMNLELWCFWIGQQPWQWLGIELWNGMATGHAGNLHALKKTEPWTVGQVAAWIPCPTGFNGPLIFIICISVWDAMRDAVITIFHCAHALWRIPFEPNGKPSTVMVAPIVCISFQFLKVHLRSSMVESSWESLLRRRENKCCCSPAEMRNIRSVWRSSPLKINLLHPWKSVIQNLCEKFN